MSLSALELDVLRLCAVDDWTSPAGTAARRDLCQRYGHGVNEQAIRARLYQLKLVDESDRLTFVGKVELWHADSLRKAS